MIADRCVMPDCDTPRPAHLTTIEEHAAAGWRRSLGLCGEEDDGYVCPGSHRSAASRAVDTDRRHRRDLLELGDAVRNPAGGFATLATIPAEVHLANPFAGTPLEEPAP